MRVLVFTCRRDAGKAACATRTMPRGWSVAWVVDQTDKGMVVPAGVERIVTPFERGSNLYGTDACLGIAKLLCEQAEVFGRIGKVDSDCILVDPSFLETGDLAGMRHKTHRGAVYGMAYAMSRKAAQEAFRGVCGAIRDGLTLGPEDAEITKRSQSGGGVLDIGAFWQSKHNGATPPKGRVALHCGYPAVISPVGPAVENEMLRLGHLTGSWRR